LIIVRAPEFNQIFNSNLVKSAGSLDLLALIGRVMINY